MTEGQWKGVCRLGVVDTMLNTLKAAWGRNRTVIGNYAALSVVQFTSYLAPLILIPYLTRVLGLSRFGLVELARAVCVYFLILTEYGFNFSATREVSVHRDDPVKLSEVFSAVMILKLLLTLLGVAGLSAIVFAVPKLRADWPMYYLSFAGVVGMWLFPVWLFQGLERMKHIAVLNVFAQAFVIAATIVLVRNADDYLLVPLVSSAGSLLIGGAALVLAMRSFPIRFHIPSAVVLKREFLDGWHLFVSRLVITLYTTGNVVVLGLFRDTVCVAYYAAGEKVVRATIGGFIVPLSQATFPHIGRLASQSKRAALRFAARLAGLFSVVTLAISAGLFLTAPQLAYIALGEDWRGGATVIRILSFLPLIVGLSNVFGVQIMVNVGLEKCFAKILTAASVLNLTLAVLLGAWIQHRGAAIALLTTELFVTTATWWAVRQNRRDVSDGADKAVDNRGLVS